MTIKNKKLLEKAKKMSGVKKEEDIITQALQFFIQEFNTISSGTNIRGDWSEFILENILQKSGLVKGKEYKIQEVIYSEEGKRFQPDVIVSLPEDRTIIIDSKVSLVAYEKFISAEDEIQRKLSLGEHVTIIRNHMRNLSSRNYKALYQIESLDFVLMFMPIESAFVLTVQNDSDILNDAFDKNIVIVSPSTLLAILRTFVSIWHKKYQIRNAFEKSKQSGSLSIYELSKHLAGSIEGPEDLGTNKKYLEGFGVE
jgi:DNA recombination protein RmuC